MRDAARQWLAAAILATIWLLPVGGAPAQPPVTNTPLTTSSSADTPEYLLLTVERLMQVDATIADPGEAKRKFLDGLRQVPAIVARIERDWPQSRYRAHAKSRLIDALTLLRQYDDSAGTSQALTAAARELLELKPEPPLAAKAHFTLLSVELSGSLEAATQPAQRRHTLADFAGRFVRLAEDHAATPYAPAALYAAALLSVEAERPADAAGLLEKLAASYPRDAAAHDGLLLLVQLYHDAGQPDRALAAKKKLVAEFPDAAAALRYRTDIAQSESVGKDFHLRFRALDGSIFNVRDHRGKAVWVYFFLSAATDRTAEQVAAQLAELTKLAGEHGAVLVAVGADEPGAAEAVAGRLAAHGVDCQVLLDAQRQVANQYGVLVAPSVAVVDAQGKLAAIIPGPQVLSAMRAYLSAASSQPGGQTAPPRSDAPAGGAATQGK